MTAAELEFLKSSIDQTVLLETAQGQRLLAKILVVVDEGETPDLFCVEVEPTPLGYAPKQEATHSILLADIVSVQLAPPLF